MNVTVELFKELRVFDPADAVAVIERKDGPSAPEGRQSSISLQQRRYFPNALFLNPDRDQNRLGLSSGICT
jgi:hypothetical protein